MFFKILCIFAVLAFANAGYLSSPLRYAAVPVYSYATPAVSYAAAYRAVPAYNLRHAAPIAYGKSFGYSGYAAAPFYGRSFGYAGRYGW